MRPRATASSSPQARSKTSRALLGATRAEIARRVRPHRRVGLVVPVGDRTRRCSSRPRTRPRAATWRWAAARGRRCTTRSPRPRPSSSTPSTRTPDRRSPTPTTSSATATRSAAGPSVSTAATCRSGSSPSWASAEDEAQEKFGFLLDAFAFGAAAARRHRLRLGPDLRAAVGHRVHPRRHRLPEDRRRLRPVDRRHRLRSPPSSARRPASTPHRSRAPLRPDDSRPVHVRRRTSGRRPTPRWPCGCGRARSTRSWGRTTCWHAGAPLRRLVDGAAAGGGTSPVSVLLWGPPGTGKTTLAYLVARATERALRRALRRDRGGQGRAPGHRRRAARPRRRRTRDRAVRRRGAPLLQDPAGCAAPRRREPLGHPRRRDDGEPALLDHRARCCRAACCSRCGPLEADGVRALLERAVTDPRGLGRRRSTVGDEALDQLTRLVGRRRALGADRAGGRRPAATQTPGRQRRHGRTTSSRPSTAPRSATTATATSTTTSPARSSRASGAATSTRRCTTSRAWSRRGRTPGSSPAGWSSWPARTSASPTRRPCRPRSPPMQAVPLVGLPGGPHPAGAGRDPPRLAPKSNA